MSEVTRVAEETIAFGPLQVVFDLYRRHIQLGCGTHHQRMLQLPLQFLQDVGQSQTGS